MARVVIADRIRIPFADLDHACLEDLRRTCEHPNPKRQAARIAGMRWWYKIAEHIPTWRDEGKWASFPRGAWHKLRPILDAYGVPRVIEDRRTLGTITVPRPMILDPSIALRSYQDRMICSAIAVENCVVRAPTGAGKTCAGFGLVAALNLPSLVIVPTSGIKRQWEREATKKLGLRPKDVGAIGEGDWDVKPFTVALYHTLAKRKCEGLRDAFGVVIFDEVQAAGGPRAFGVLDSFSSRYRVGISAHEKRKDKLQKIVYDACGEVACTVTEDEVEAEGAIVPVRALAYPTRFRAEWYVPTLSAIEERSIVTGRDASTFDADFGRLLDEMGRDGERTAMAVEIADARLRAGGVVVVLTRRVEHVERMRAQLRALGHVVGYLAGGNAKEFDRAIIDLCDGHLRCAVGTVEAFGMGMDVPPLTDVVVAMPIATNESMLKQAKGRACRPFPGKVEARIHYLLDELVFGESHEAAVRRMFKGRFERKEAA